MNNKTINYILIAFYSLFIIIGVLTNSLIIFIIVINENLKTSEHILLINLFVSDLLLCLISMPFTLLWLIGNSWPFGALMCKIIPFVQSVTIYVSAATITSIALERMFRITSNERTGIFWTSLSFLLIKCIFDLTNKINVNIIFKLF